MASGCRKKFLFELLVSLFRTYFAIVVVILAVQRLRMVVQFQNGFVWTQTLPQTDTHTPREGEIERERDWSLF